MCVIWIIKTTITAADRLKGSTSCRPHRRGCLRRRREMIARMLSRITNWIPGLPSRLATFALQLRWNSSSSCAVASRLQPWTRAGRQEAMLSLSTDIPCARLLLPKPLAILLLATLAREVHQQSLLNGKRSALVSLVSLADHRHSRLPHSTLPHPTPPRLQAH